MIERPIPANPRIRAGSLPQPPATEPPRHWMQDRAPSFKSLARDRQRREKAWAWLSLVVLIICWDASSRLDERVALSGEEASVVRVAGSDLPPSGTGRRPERLALLTARP